MSPRETITFKLEMARLLLEEVQSMATSEGISMRAPPIVEIDSYERDFRWAASDC